MNLLNVFLGAVFCCLPVFAHEGHGIPGALPPAPHGGVVQEATHGDDHHEEGGAEETELFFEVVLKNKELSIYPLTLDPNKPNTFVKLSAKKDLSNILLKAELPRQKKITPLTPMIEDEVIKAEFDPAKGNRVLIHLSAEFKKEVKNAKLQVETRQ